jgi:hypothetical protein
MFTGLEIHSRISLHSDLVFLWHSQMTTVKQVPFSAWFMSFFFYVELVFVVERSLFC